MDKSGAKNSLNPELHILSKIIQRVDFTGRFVQKLS